MLSDSTRAGLSNPGQQVRYQWIQIKFLFNFNNVLRCASCRVVGGTCNQHGGPDPEHAYRACLGLLSLSKRYGDARLEAACILALLVDREIHSRQDWRCARLLKIAKL